MKKGNFFLLYLKVTTERNGILEVKLLSVKVFSFLLNLNIMIFLQIIKREYMGTPPKKVIRAPLYCGIVEKTLIEVMMQRFFL